MRFSDTVLGAALVIFAIVVAGYSSTFPAIPGQQYGAALFPVLVALGLAGCGVVLVVHGWASGAPFMSRAEWSERPHAVLLMLCAVAAMVIYILAQHAVGFMPVMFVFLLVLFALFRVRWPVAIVTAAIAVIVIDQIFSDLLLVPLPLGIMPRLPW